MNSWKNRHKNGRLNNLSKTASKIQFAVNKIKGKLAEEIAKQDYLDNGFEITETGIGSDFVATKKLGKITYTEYVDVKSGNAQLTKKQIQTKNILKRNGIPYSTYRVTDEHLKFEIENNSNLTKYCETIGFDITNFFGVFVIEDPTSCPNCGLFASNIDNILKNFGLRNMGDGTVRVQSWCRNCRNYSRRGRK